jgi:GntR family transcriptional regulator
MGSDFNLEIIISNNSSKPIKEQISSQIKALVMSGKLQPGDPIPSMRSLAKMIHVSVITVQRAYEDLQRDGFIETTVGRGSFISAHHRNVIHEEHRRKMHEHLRLAVEAARMSGTTLDELTRLLVMCYEEDCQ